jgi:gas vesicle protein
MQSNNTFTYFFVGLGIGTAVGMLFAPKSGAQTRNYLQSKAEDAAGQLKEQGQRAMDMANEKVERAKGAMREQAETVSRLTDAGRRAYEEGSRAFNERSSS